MLTRSVDRDAGPGDPGGRGYPIKREWNRAPGSTGSRISAFAGGYPVVIVPFGLVPRQPDERMPGFDPKPVPFGVTFAGTACSEPRLIELAYAFEQATMRRVTPPEGWLDKTS